MPKKKERAYAIVLTPHLNPKYSLPASVKYLPVVLEGIRNGEIDVTFEPVEDEDKAIRIKGEESEKD